MVRPKTKTHEQLTASELQVMNVLWQKKSANARDVLTTINEDSEKELAYTTVSTVLRVLEKKGFVTSEKDGKTHLYAPIASKTAYQKKATKELVKSVFLGKPTALVKNLLGSEEISADELEDIEKMIGDLKKKL